MKHLVLVISLAAVFIGCTPNPRFRTGEAPPRRPEASEEEREPQENGREYRSFKNNKYQSVTTDDLIELGRIIQSYLGKPYRGMSINEKGMDCSQFCQKVFREFNGTELPRTVEKQLAFGYSVGRNNFRYGDLVFFRTEGREISHVGIYIGFGEFIHSSSSTGVIITKMDDKYWRKRLAGGRRVIL